VDGPKGAPKETWLRIEMPSAKQYGGGGWTVMEAHGGAWVPIGAPPPLAPVMSPHSHDSSAPALSAAFASLRRRIPVLKPLVWDKERSDADLGEGTESSASNFNDDPSPANTVLESGKKSPSCDSTNQSLPWGPTGYADPTDAEVGPVIVSFCLGCSHF